MNRERGLALVLTAVLGTIAMAIWLLSYRATMDAIRTERRVIKRTERDTTVTRALAEAVALLRTGPPPGPLASYLFEIGKGKDQTTCTVTYNNLGGEEWEVEARLATELDKDLLPPAPQHFKD